ncbi:hypothetical protein BKA93DRAFT_786242 [Sparassis latifolia]
MQPRRRRAPMLSIPFRALGISGCCACDLAARAPSGAPSVYHLCCPERYRIAPLC